MASSLRRKVRRYLLGATQKATRLRWIGQFTVRVMSVSQVTSTRSVREKSLHGAEKSRLTRRRKRGLRKGKVRSRVRQTRRSLPHRQPIPKAPSLRVVNHRRRTERWLVKASESFRKDLEVYVRISRKAGPPPLWGGRPAIPGKRSVKLHCMAKWQRLHMRASALGFPPKLAFDSSFFRYLSKEFPVAERRYVDSHALLFGRSAFTYMDPPEEPRVVTGIAPPSSLLPGYSPSKKTGGEMSPADSLNCPYCGYRVFRRRPVCQRDSCGKTLKWLFELPSGPGPAL